MSIQHAIIDDPDIHEPKGISTAASGECYIADGVGSGSRVASAGSSFGEIYIDSGVTAQTLSQPPLMQPLIRVESGRVM